MEYIEILGIIMFRAKLFFLSNYGDIVVNFLRILSTKSTISHKLKHAKKLNHQGIFFT